jgi:hypothetical protein
VAVIEEDAADVKKATASIDEGVSFFSRVASALQKAAEWMSEAVTF